MECSKKGRTYLEKNSIRLRYTPGRTEYRRALSVKEGTYSLALSPLPIYIIPLSLSLFLFFSSPLLPPFFRRRFRSPIRSHTAHGNIRGNWRFHRCWEKVGRSKSRPFAEKARSRLHCRFEWVRRRGNYLFPPSHATTPPRRFLFFAN